MISKNTYQEHALRPDHLTTSPWQICSNNQYTPHNEQHTHTHIPTQPNRHRPQLFTQCHSSALSPLGVPVASFRITRQITTLVQQFHSTRTHSANYVYLPKLHGTKHLALLHTLAHTHTHSMHIPSEHTGHTHPLTHWTDYDNAFQLCAPSPHYSTHTHTRIQAHSASVLIRMEMVGRRAVRLY